MKNRINRVSRHEPLAHPEIMKMFFSVGARGRAPLRVVFTETME